MYTLLINFIVITACSINPLYIVIYIYIYIYIYSGMFINNLYNRDYYFRIDCSNTIIRVIISGLII